MNPKLSFIIASRNDSHGGHPMDRLQKTLDTIAAADPSIPGDYETIIVDWGSETRISRVISYTDTEKCIYIPPSICSQYPTDFNEVLALNIGIRRARGEWIARLDQDILVGDRFFKWFETSNIEPGSKNSFFGSAFFSLRREMLPKQTIPKEHDPVWAHWPLDTPDFWRGAVGILLAPRKAWINVRGYDESLIYRNHMEHDLCMRFQETCGLVNLGPIIDAPFHHQWHEQVDKPSNELKPDFKLSHLDTRLNDENWGLGNVELEEE